jgi:hypothetical protein
LVHALRQTRARARASLLARVAEGRANSRRERMRSQPRNVPARPVTFAPAQPRTRLARRPATALPDRCVLMPFLAQQGIGAARTPRRRPNARRGKANTVPPVQLAAKVCARQAISVTTLQAR